jgi:hypothetical protein
MFRSYLIIVALGEPHVVPCFTRIPATVLEAYSHTGVCADGKKEVMREISRDLIVRAFANGAVVKFHNLLVREDMCERALVDIRGAS